MLDLWYKNAVIYCLDVKTFMDSNGDGVGDFRGLTDRLDHLEELGVTCAWLLPFYPSPNRDNGYDVTDFYAVDPKLGTLGDFVELTRAAADRGIRVIIDLVVNHTSVDHPWFQQARADPESPYRDWYVWSKEKPENAEEGVVFPGVQEAIWSYDEAAGAWYLHRFYKHQADLNIGNPAVREEIDRIMGFWLQLGVSGFRLDAVPFLIEHLGLPDAERRDPHVYLTEMRAFLSWRRAGAILLAEANIEMDDVDEYFGDGDRMHMIFNFPLNQHLFLAMVRGEAEPIARVLDAAPAMHPVSQWASFLRNHDELDLGRLTEAERQEVFAALGPEPEMQIYGRGIRRRLAPMLGGDPARLKLAYSLMFSLPGTPVLWYGEEIGMGEDLSLRERNSVRTPMQWADEPNAAFSTAPADRLIRPVIADGPFGFPTLNAASQRGGDGGLMGEIRRMIRVRRSCPAIGWGQRRRLDLGDPGVLGLRYDWQGETITVVHNLADRPVTVHLDGGERQSFQTLLGNGAGQTHDAEMAIELEPYGYRWLRSPGERR